MVPERTWRRERRPIRSPVRTSSREPRAGGPSLLSPPSPPRPVRAELPTDHRALPALGEDFTRPLDTGLAALGLTLDPRQRAAIEAQARLLVAWGGAINLTALRTPTGIALEHVVDSLTAMELLRGVESLLDLGSGAGYPGLPLAVCVPVPRVALVEPVGKKARFLTAAASAALSELSGGGGDAEAGSRIDVLAERAEDLAHDPRHRAAWDVVVCRAVAAMAELIELALPFLKRGGRLVAWKRDDGTGSLDREIAAAGEAGFVAGGASPEIHPVRVSGLEDHRLVVITKVRASPDHLPRSPVERRRPLVR